MSDKNNAGEIAMGCLVLILLIPVSAAFKGFVLSRLWGYFVVPLGVPEIGIAHAFGLALVVSMFTPTPSGKDKDSEEGMGERVIRAIFMSFGVPALILLIGWIVSCCM